MTEHSRDIPCSLKSTTYESQNVDSEAMTKQLGVPDDSASQREAESTDLCIHKDQDELCDPGQDLTPLSPEELALLKELEAAADGAVSTWLLAMGEIRDNKLYRFDENGSPQTWEEYCRRRFKMTKQYIDKLLRAEFVNQVIRETKVSEPLKSVAHADALHGLEPKEIVIAVGEVNATTKAENRKPKTADYKKARENLGKQKPAKPRPGKKMKNNAPVAPAKLGATKGNVKPKVGNLNFSISLTKPVSFIVESIGELGLDPHKAVNDDDDTTLQINGNGEQQAHVLRSLAEWIKANGAMTVGVTLDK